ncbi:DNA-binding response regulator, OmpR family, contains REC and winged-helix (wHTH) domain [Paenibacillus catalpae]|uniref:DNA-binding response regulator, OmpR family, contains REC and winged-helix (WHTH) domain n=1 Tax=Paenibacillus catalpae TaxID=1045775 RepID=A0A1I2GJ26_9BACL|nr:response regulator transcription factor [Paenibacillus catalpae]SFF16746.1 DNA-binding response regulator, OmpR family, contains REC and winged-helix (wHTH) domain [Paenibacillus catalpae]
MKTILVVEDEPAIARVLVVYLRKAGFDVMLASDGRKALELYVQKPPSLILLDVMLPHMDGWEVLHQIRETSSCPIIMLTARDGIDDRLSGLNGGADDYMSKPFIPEEVVARVHAVLRRPSQWTDEGRQSRFGRLSIDFLSQRVTLSGAEVTLMPRDMAVLLYLAEHPNRTFTRDQLIENVWGTDYEGSDRAVDLSIKRIRQALSHWPAEEGEIRTLRGTGYQFWIEN